MDRNSIGIDGVEGQGQRKPRVSIVLPACDGSSAVAKSLSRVAAYLRAVSWPAEVIVVDDGNKDDTHEVVAAQQSRFESLVIVTHKKRRGPGAAARSGVLLAKGSYVVLAEVGFAAEAAQMEVLIGCLSAGSDVAIASRKIEADIRAPSHGAASRLTETAFTWASRLIVPTGVRDLFSGLIAFRSRSVHLIAARSKIEHAAYVVEWMALAQYLGQQVIECPVRLARPTGCKARRGLLDLARLGDLWSIRRRLSGFEYSRPQSTMDLMHETSFVRMDRALLVGAGSNPKG